MLAVRYKIQKTLPNVFLIRLPLSPGPRESPSLAGPLPPAPGGRRGMLRFSNWGSPSIHLPEQSQQMQGCSRCVGPGAAEWDWLGGRGTREPGKEGLGGSFLFSALGPRPHISPSMDRSQLCDSDGPIERSVANMRTEFWSVTCFRSLVTW